MDRTKNNDNEKLKYFHYLVERSTTKLFRLVFILKLFCNEVKNIN